jgi:starch phosphorylase
MVSDYVRNLYVPAAQASRALAAGSRSAARDLAAWKRRVRDAWPSVHVEHVEAEGAELSLGSRLTVRVAAALGGLSADDVCAEVVYGRAADDDEIIDPCYATLTADEGDFGGAAHFSGSVELGRPGPFGYTVRLLPKHPLLASRAELGLITCPDAPAGMTNGDLR